MSPTAPGPLADGTDLAASLPTTHTAGWYAGPADLYPQVSETITPSLSDMTQGAPA